MKQAVLVTILLTLLSGPAWADNCGKSREYLLSGLGGDLMMPPQAYDDLFKRCKATAAMTNVKDAYVLKDGGIAVIAKKPTVAATAATLSEFCEAYPRATLRFVTPKELLHIKSIEDVIKLSSTSSTSCQKIKGLS